MRPDQLPKVLTALAMVVLLATLIIKITVPEPNAEEEKRTIQGKISKARVATDTARKAAESGANIVRLRTWQGSAGTIASSARERLTAIAAREGVRITAFRPQRDNTGGELSQLPFVATVDGPFPNVVRFVQSAEAPTVKLAVNLVQISSSDDASDRVTATVGLLAYLAPVEPDNG